MNRRTSVILPLMTLALTTGHELEAGVVPGRWEKVAGQPVGTQLTVTLRSGQQIHCVFRQLTEEGLIVVDPVSGVSELSQTSVSRITTWEERDDRNLNGLLIGLGAGTLLGALSAGEVSAAGGNGAGSIAASAGLGGLIGYLVDKAQRQPELLYSAPGR